MRYLEQQACGGVATVLVGGAKVLRQPHVCQVSLEGCLCGVVRCLVQGLWRTHNRNTHTRMHTTLGVRVTSSVSPGRCPPAPTTNLP